MTDIDEVIERMERLQEDSSIPSNVDTLLEDSIEALQDDSDELSVRVNTAASFLDEISNDPNIAQHTRTEVWNIASMLENLEE